MQTALKMENIQFIDHTVAQGKPDNYVTVDVDIESVLKSWKSSLFSFEWMHNDGRLRTLDELPLAQRQKRLDTQQAIENGMPLVKPVLGIGMLGSVEIGSGKAVFLTLAAAGYKAIPVHITLADKADFAAYLAK